MTRLMISSAGSRRRSSVPADEGDRVGLDQRLVLGELLGPEHRRDRAGEVLEGELGHARQARAALLDVAHRDAGDHAAEGDLGLLGDAAEVGHLVRPERLQTPAWRVRGWLVM
jgi:hypothetical protein